LWCYITKQNLESYLYRYPVLAENFNEVCLYQNGDNLFFPRLFYKSFPDPSLKLFTSTKPYMKQTFFKFTGKLRPEQVEIVNSVLATYNKNGMINGIIKGRPGIGKTVIAVYLSAKLGVKTCIVVDTEPLLKQWVAAFKEFTDLKETEIGIIKQKLFSTDTPISIAFVQTLISKVKTNLPKAFEEMEKAGFGLVLFDEVHSTSSAPKFSRASLLFRTVNILGLSATPFQSGIAEILMKNTIGEIIFENKHYELKPKYVLNYYDSKTPGKYSFVMSKMNDYIKRKAFYNSIIVKSPIYFDLIVSLVKRRLLEEHIIMILCFTKQQVLLISEKLTNLGIENRKFYGDEKEKVDKENVKVLIVTYAFAGKGFDFAQLSCLILATNLAGKKSLIQVIGRILREYKGKIPPVVDDLIDLCFPSMFLPDVKAKKSIVKEEFSCEIIDVKFEDDGLSGELR